MIEMWSPIFTGISREQSFKAPLDEGGCSQTEAGGSESMMPAVGGGLSGLFSPPGIFQGQVMCFAVTCSDICLNVFLLQEWALRGIWVA